MKCQVIFPGMTIPNISCTFLVFIHLVLLIIKSTSTASFVLSEDRWTQCCGTKHFHKKGCTANGNFHGICDVFKARNLWMKRHLLNVFWRSKHMIWSFGMFLGIWGPPCDKHHKKGSMDRLCIQCIGVNWFTTSIPLFVMVIKVICTNGSYLDFPLLSYNTVPTEKT